MAKNTFTINLKAKLKDVNESAKTIQSQINQLEKKVGELNVDLKINKNAQSEINKQFKEINSKLTTLQNQANIKLKVEGVDKAKKQFDTLQKALDNLSSGINVNKSGDIEGFTQKSQSITSAGQAITKYTDELGRQLTVTRSLNGENEKYSARLTTTNKIISDVESAEKKITKVYKTREQALKDVGLTQEKLNEEFEQPDIISKDSGQYIEKYNNVLKDTVTLTKRVVDGNETWSASYKKISDDAEDFVHKFAHDWERAWESFTTYMTVQELFHALMQSIKSAVEQVEKLDSALVELQKVSNISKENLGKFTNEAYAMADSVAKTGSEMIEAATEFSKAGYADDQILKLGKLALMYTNIADEEIEAGDAANFMIAQLKAFNLEGENLVDNAEMVINSVNEVSNNFAVSSADLANNIGNASAVMANAGNSLAQTIGLMTAGTEITRDASKVANGKKTKPYIYSNMYINTVLNPVILKALMTTA